MRFGHLLRPLATGLLGLCLGLTPGTYGIPGFEDSTGWVNGAPLAPRDLEGKVVLVEFWDYTCVNCLRTLPYLRTWYRRYHDDGFTIVGVHTPEFEFSGEQKNVEAATRRLDIDWPVALDRKRAIWSRYGNVGLPHEYLFDQDGRLVDTILGEGSYQETESKIQSLLKARNPKLELPPVMALLPQDSYAKPGAICYLHTPSFLMNRSRIASSATPDAPHADGSVYLEGAWRVTADAAISADGPTHLSLRYHAIEVVGVFAPPPSATVRVDVTQDGLPIAKSDAGADLRYDTDGTSFVTVDTARAYELTMNAKMAFHELRLGPASSGLGVYSFAFESCEVPGSRPT